ncbi:MAG: roadblock/LC7 domain-containing protein [Candidatus Jordarchaeum sp.]|uniref:roadblock/LC7 domain-containing protein n=1 Tax=Candidatus Jordarchaeum sp. TaxID=2823881 RepID=UPI004048FCA9
MKTAEAEELEKILTSLQNISEIEGVAIVTRNGNLISSNLPRDIDGQKFAAMSASMVGASETAAALMKSFAKRIIVEIERGKILALGAGPKAILVVSIKENANIEDLTPELEKYRKDVMKIFR